MRGGRVARVSIIGRLAIFGIVSPVGKAIDFICVNVAACFLFTATTQSGRNGCGCGTDQNQSDV